VNGERVKSAKSLAPGDKLAIRIGEFEWVIEVKALSDRRGPAEPPASFTRRTKQAGYYASRRSPTAARRRTCGANVKAVPRSASGGTWSAGGENDEG
jgi:ribosome-associated heat shock protein Hsp15